jgi:cation diffusion facilitator family transporter
MGVATLINYFVTAYEYKKGLALKSDILVADSYHTKSDIYVSLVVMVSMLGVALGFPFLDGIVSFLIAILIARMAIEILKSTSRVLCDSAVLASESLRSAVMSVKGVIDCHEVRTRGREDEVLVDLHIHVDRSMHVDDAHEISSEIENLIKTKFSGVKEVIVHIEPTQDK